MMVKVAWVSRHPPLKAQIRELERMLEHVELEIISDTFRDAKAVADAVQSAGAVISVVVLPLSMLAQYLPLARRMGVDVWFAEMEGLHECEMDCGDFNPDTDVWLPLRGTPKGRHMRFKEFRKVKEVRVETEPITGRDLMKYAVAEEEMEI